MSFTLRRSRAAAGSHNLSPGALCFCWKAKRPGKRKYPGLRDIEDDGETRELGMKKGASARSWGNLEDPNRTALIKTESFGTSEKYMSARI